MLMEAEYINQPFPENELQGIHPNLSIFASDDNLQAKVLLIMLMEAIMKCLGLLKSFRRKAYAISTPELRRAL